MGCLLSQLSLGRSAKTASASRTVQASATFDGLPAACLRSEAHNLHKDRCERIPRQQYKHRLVRSGIRVTVESPWVILGSHYAPAFFRFRGCGLTRS